MIKKTAYESIMDRAKCEGLQKLFMPVSSDFMKTVELKHIPNSVSTWAITRIS